MRHAIPHGDGADSALNELAWGYLKTGHVQLVPQSRGLLDEAACDFLLDVYPSVQFRLHANVSVQRRFDVVDLVDFHREPEWVRQAGRISQRLGASVYSAHSGKRAHGSMQQMLDNARRAQDAFGAPVAIEGQYPSDSNVWLVSTWQEYRELFDSGLPYVIDLSHLNILAAKCRQREDALVKEMLSCERCMEVHVSANDGSGDWHQACLTASSTSWWGELLEYTHGDAVIFSEGNHLRQRTPPSATT